MDILSISYIYRLGVTFVFILFFVSASMDKCTFVQRILFINPVVMDAISSLLCSHFENHDDFYLFYVLFMVYLLSGILISYCLFLVFLKIPVLYLIF